MSGTTIHSCRNEHKISTLEAAVDTLNKKVWQGNGEPSIITQLALLTQAIKGLCWLVGLVATTVIAQVITNVLSK